MYYNYKEFFLYALIWLVFISATFIEYELVELLAYFTICLMTILGKFAFDRKKFDEQQIELNLVKLELEALRSRVDTIESH